MLREVEREANAITLKLEGPEANVDVVFALDSETGVLSVLTRADADTPLASLAAATLLLPRASPKRTSSAAIGRMSFAKPAPILRTAS